MTYHHLSSEERDKIAVLRNQGLTWRAIGDHVGRAHSSLLREWRRNRHKPPWGRKVYLPHSAQKKADHRHRHSHRRLPLKSMDMHLEVMRLLEKRWSPELIAGRLRRIRPDLPTVSPEAIYQWIYHHRRDLIRYLARAHPKRRRRWYLPKHRQRIPGRLSIRHRPDPINQRLDPGHWETDLVVGPGSCSLQVLVERQCRYTLLQSIAQKTASTSRAGLTLMLTTIPAHLRRSITYDNGAENAEHLVLNDDFDMRSYFCEPYHSWEKGTVENTNGLIRRFIPKGTRIETLSPTSLVQLQDWLNDRPRKILNFQTPREAFQALGALTG